MLAGKGQQRRTQRRWMPVRKPTPQLLKFTHKLLRVLGHTLTVMTVKVSRCGGGSPEFGFLHAFVPKAEPDISCLSYPDVKLSPPMKVVKGFTCTSTQQGYDTLSLTEDYWSDVPLTGATDQYLSFFNCRFADGLKQISALNVEEEVMDFNYKDYKTKWVVHPKFGAGVLALEHHDFIHLEYPMRQSSGYFLPANIRKKVDGEVDEDQIHRIAFSIPILHAVYAPPRAIHSHGHIEGLWRTLLSSFSEEETKAGKNYVNHAHHVHAVQWSTRMAR